MRFRLLAASFLALAVSAAALTADDWPQWGGANRNFMTGSRDLAASWPAGGPKQIWSRDLGEGYSAVVADGGRLYTMYSVKPKLLQIGKPSQEVVIAMDAATGKTIWEYSYDAAPLAKMNLEYGPGPHATPLIVGNTVFTVGAMGKFLALDMNTGTLLWAHDFFKEFDVVWGRGYSCSPIAYKDTVIVTLGKVGRSVIAFNQKTGATVWQKQDFDYGPSSPILISLEDSGAPAPVKTGRGKVAISSNKQDQLVVFMANEIAGLDPSNGDFLWSHPHKTDWGLNISTPVFWSSPEGNFIFCSSAYSGGSRLLQLTRTGGKTSAKEMWFSSRMRIHIGNAIRVGDYVFGSSGDFGPAFFAAIEVKTGRVAFQDRSFSRATSVYADGKFIILDEDGNLALATATPEGLKVASRAQILKNNAWTPPTLAGKTLYIRDRKTIRALDLG